MKYTFVAVVLSWLIAGPVLAQPSPDDAGRFNISAEALLWWFKGNAAPPLVTDGLFGEPRTNVLLGGKDLDTNPNPGFRVSAGYALTKTWGVEGSFFYVPPRSTTRGVSSSGQPGSTDLWVTFIDPNIPDESLTELSAAGFFAGSATETLRNSLMGAELIVNRTVNPFGAPAFTDDPPGPQIGPAEPSFKFNSSGFWAQGLNIGLAFRF